MKKKEEEDLTCAVKACDRPHTRNGAFCTRCTAWNKYWKDRSKQDRYARHLQVTFWTKRMTQRWGVK